MQVFVPVSRFLVEYDVAEGAAYSPLESLVLRAISNGINTISALEKEFRVHRRLIVEALATLTSEGWLALKSGGNASFLITSAGRKMLATDGGLQACDLTPRFESVFMERMTGGLVSGREVNFLTSKQIDDDRLDGIRLRAVVTKDTLLEGEVESYLRVGKQEWVHWIRDIELKSKGQHWLSLTVSECGKHIEYIPEIWKYRLVEPVLSELAQKGLIDNIGPVNVDEVCRKMITSADADDSAADFGKRKVLRANVEKQDFLLSNGAHAGYLRRVLRESRSNVLIASAFISTDTINAIRADLMSALQRGVSIDLLWGYEIAPDKSGGTVEWLRKLQDDTSSSGVRGTLQLNEQPTDSHSKFICWDSVDGYHVVLGSFNWLSASSSDDVKGNNVSIIFHEPQVVAKFCRISASLWALAQDKQKSTTVSRWKRIAATLSEHEDAPVPLTRIEMVHDTEHVAVMTRLLNKASQDVVVASHQLGEVAATRIESAVVNAASNRFIYGKESATGGRVVVDRATEVVHKFAGILERKAGLHAKFIIADDEICISSFNFLSADPFQTSADCQELGVLIKSADLANWLKSEIS